MSKALLALALGAVLVGCSTGGDEHPGAPTSAPASTPATAPSALGPTTTADVPAGAFLAAEDLGQGWSAVRPGTTPCAATYARTSVGSRGLTDSRGVLTETVATGVDVPAAVRAWRQALSGCGFDVRDDALGDALGDASVSGSSDDGQDAVLVTGTEGVLVVLHAHGSLAGARDELDGWADLALGTSCVAAPDGCH